MNRPQILIIGLGGVGGWILELIARCEDISYVVGADVNEEWGRKRLSTTASGVVLQGYYPRLEFVKIDLQDVEGTAKTINRLQPRVIINCTTLQTWWLRYQHLSPEKAKRLSQAGAGPWMPTHLALARKLMLAIRESGWDGFVINSGFADCSNMVLAKRGMEPTIGLGNIDLVVPFIQMGAADRLGLPIEDVVVYAVFHHHHFGSFKKRAHDLPQYFLRIMVDDQDVTGDFDTNRFLHEVTQNSLSGENLNPVVAASGVKNALALLLDSGLHTHSPGPQGLPGGYPIRLSAKGAEVSLPPGITLQEAIAINEISQRADGIERVDDEGTVFFTEESTEIMKEVLGYDLAPLRFDDCDQRAEELVAQFKALQGT